MSISAQANLGDSYDQEVCAAGNATGAGVSLSLPTGMHDQGKVTLTPRKPVQHHDHRKRQRALLVLVRALPSLRARFTSANSLVVNSLLAAESQARRPSRPGATSNTTLTLNTPLRAGQVRLEGLLPELDQPGRAPEQGPDRQRLVLGLALGHVPAAARPVAEHLLLGEPDQRPGQLAQDSLRHVSDFRGRGRRLVSREGEPLQRELRRLSLGEPAAGRQGERLAQPRGSSRPARRAAPSSSSRRSIPSSSTTPWTSAEGTTLPRAR